MKKISAVNILKNDIRQLEERQAREWLLLKAQSLYTYENLKPLNILRRTLNEANESGYEKNDNYLGKVMGLTAGFLSNVLIPGRSFGRVKDIFSTLLQLGVSNVIGRRHSKTENN